jgi:hypothetical protein
VEAKDILPNEVNGIMTRLLEPITVTDGLSILVQKSSDPVITYSMSSIVKSQRFDYVCGCCKKMVLIENTIRGDLWGLAFQCFGCGGISISPDLPAGEPAPAPRIILSPGEHPTTPVKFDHHNFVLINSTAYDRYKFEVGIGYNGFQENLSKDGLKSFIKRIELILGDIYLELIKIDERGISSIRTPPKNRHRLMEIIEIVNRDSNNMDNKVPTINILHLSELQAASDLLERWKNYPKWRDLVLSIKSPSDFCHTMILLATASSFVNIEQGVGLYAKNSNVRTPDIWVAVSAEHRLNIEVKAPLKLQRSEYINFDIAEGIVEKCLKRADTGRRGQLSQENPGVLAIGGFHLSAEAIANLEEACRTMFSRLKSKCGHIVGISIVSLSALINDKYIVSNGTQIKTESGPIKISSHFDFSFVDNPFYSGNIRLQIDKTNVDLKRITHETENIINL